MNCNNIYQDARNNIIYGDLKIQRNINIDFGDGKNNIVFIANIATNVSISFKGNNSLVFLSDWCHLGGKGIIIYSNSICYLGKCTYIGEATIWISECQNFIIGDNCLFSSNIWFRTTDQHMIYDNLTNRRINTGRSIYIGDHVWGGYGSSYLKGSFIASGSIIGNASVVLGKVYRSNTINAGVPCKEVKQNIFWITDTPDRSDFDSKVLESYKIFNSDEFKYCYEKNIFLSPYDLEEKINSFSSAREKLVYLYDTIYTNTNKNRFAYDKKKLTLSNTHFGVTNVKTRTRSHLAYKLGESLVQVYKIGMKKMGGQYVFKFFLKIYKLIERR
ncbi:hypothetical protein L8T94_03070 [Campylobacter lari]|nr:hypothetical protein [Campylobacter lari]